MRELDIMRGFAIPNAERNFRVVNPTTIVSTVEPEENYFLWDMPMQIAMHGGNAISSNKTEQGVYVSGPEEIMTDVVRQLRKAGFPEELSEVKEQQS